jgi:hypothetical protein
MRSSPPLFVPLKTEHFRAFERGEKSVEYRRHGPRWNSSTCWPGRAVTLSHGYSGARIPATIESVSVVLCADAPESCRSIYPIDAPLIALCMCLMTDQA